jgi:nucleoside-diphosphate-sugar epimerase
MNPSIKDPKHVFIMGYGDIGRRVAEIWLDKAIPVTAISRSVNAIDSPNLAMFESIKYDLDMPEQHDLNIFKENNGLLYYFAPPPASGILDTRMAGFLSRLESLGAFPSRIVLISTSGIYGDQKGGWVTEQTPPRPMVDRARRRLGAETLLRQFAETQGIELVILRVGGIYAADRLPVSRIEKRVPVLHESLAPQTNRIHAHDLATICVAAAQRGGANSIYNVSDGCESNMTDYFNQIATHLGLPKPPTIDMQEAERVLSKGMLSYLKESRRMDNRLMLKELGIVLRYPDLASGLNA